MFKTTQKYRWAAPRKKGPWGNFEQNVYFPTFWMAIILRLICENLSCIAVKISFLWGCEHCVYAEALFTASVTSRYLHNDMQNFTSVILYMNIIYITR